ncbi:MAG: hypothetical protein LBG28_12625 [Tannerella sp.]|nr:hypothetical protein [Tannerella sp.]
MNILDIFRSAEVLKIVFQLGYMPEKEEFYELTPEQYEQYYKTEGQHDSRDQKVFMLLPHDAKKYNEIASGDVFVVTEQEMSYFDSAKHLIESYCKDSDTPFDSFEDKLYYVAKFVPDICIKGTKFEKAQLIVRKS